MKNTQNTQNTQLQEKIEEKKKEYYLTKLASGGYKTNHILHLIVSIITMGYWIPIWAIVALYNDIQRTKAEEYVYGFSKPNTIGRIFPIIVIVFFLAVFSIMISAFTDASNRLNNTDLNQTIQTKTIQNKIK